MEGSGQENGKRISILSTGRLQYLGFHSRNGRTGKQDSWEAPEPRRDVGLEASGAWWGIAISLEQAISCPGPRLSSLQMSTVNFKNLTYFQKYLLSTYFMPSGHIRLCCIMMSAGPLGLRVQCGISPPVFMRAARSILEPVSQLSRP